MLGYDTSWAAFAIVEVMSYPWYGYRRLAYLAASLSFRQETDVILLTTHLFKKVFSQNQGPSSSSVPSAEGAQYEVGAALDCLANICTPQLATDLLSDIYAIMNRLATDCIPLFVALLLHPLTLTLFFFCVLSLDSSRPYLRKKSVLVLYQIFRQWPKALRLSFPRLKVQTRRLRSLYLLYFLHDSIPS